MLTSFPSWRIRDLLLATEACKKAVVQNCQVTSDCAKMSGIFSPPVQVIFISSELIIGRDN